MNLRELIRASCAAILFVVLLGAVAVTPAGAASRTISGKLNKPGYTVIAASSAGKSLTVVAKKGKFKVRAPASVVTLHLRAPNGTYAGPVVIASVQKGKRAILGVKRGAKLGTVTVNKSKGYAKLRKRLAKKWIATSRKAKARKGVPIGAGKAGLVRSTNTRGGPGDKDLDGISNSFDIDDDGDKILDGYDRTLKVRGSSAGKNVAGMSAPSFGDGSQFMASTSLGGVRVEPTATVNANGGSSDAQIAAAQQELGSIAISWLGVDAHSAQLDCGALVYCSMGGTGRLVTQAKTAGPSADPTRSTSLSFPECCDDDDTDLFGAMTPIDPADRPPNKGAHKMGLFHGATADQIHASDVLIERATLDGAAVQYTTSLGFVFSSFPVMAGYDDGQGHKSTFSYPRPSGSTCLLTDDAAACPKVKISPTGEAIVALRFWRPQRSHTAGDPGIGKWIDVGDLVYTVQVDLESDDQPPPPGPTAFCKHSSFSQTDPNIVPLTSAQSNGVPTDYAGVSTADSVFGDVLGDRESSPENTFNTTLNVTNCLSSQGITLQSMPKFKISINAYALNDNPEAGRTSGTKSSTTFRWE